MWLLLVFSFVTLSGVGSEPTPMMYRSNFLEDQQPEPVNPWRTRCLDFLADYGIILLVILFIGK
jgi:hypothetical protein